LLLDIEVEPKGILKIEAADFWLRQATVSKPINSLFLSRSSVQKGQVAFIGMSVKKSELANRNLNVDFVTKEESLRIELSKELLWK
jgi:arginine repressor